MKVINITEQRFVESRSHQINSIIFFTVFYMFDKATPLLLQVIKIIYQGLWFILHQSNEGGFRFGGLWVWFFFFFGRRLGVAKKSHK